MLARVKDRTTRVIYAATLTVGGAMFGNCAIGSVGIEMMPSSRITRENTDAKIGRLRKNSTTVPSTARKGAWLLPEAFRRQPGVERGHFSRPDHGAALL